MIGRLAALAGAAAGDAQDQLLVGRVEHEHVVQLLAALGEHAGEAFRLRDRARKSIEQEPALGVGLAETIGDEIQHDLIGDELALVDELFRARAERRVRLDGCSQHVAGGDVWNLENLGQPDRLSPFPRARGSKQQKVLTQWPGPSPGSLAADGARAAPAASTDARSARSGEALVVARDEV